MGCLLLSKTRRLSSPARRNPWIKLENSKKVPSDANEGTSAAKTVSQIVSLAESKEPQHRALRLFVRYVEYSTRRYKQTLPGSYFQNLKRLRYAVMVLVR